MKEIIENFHNKTVLVTGAAGFNGANLVRRLYEAAEGITVVGLDNMNDYYDVLLKEERLRQLEQYPNFTFVQGKLQDIPKEYNEKLTTKIASDKSIFILCISSSKSSS